MRTLKRIWSLITTLVVVVMICLAILLVGVRVVGLTPYAVLSGSMEPTYHVGSLIYVKEVDPAAIEIGTPITFVVNEDLLVATHRVVDVQIVHGLPEPAGFSGSQHVGIRASHAQRQHVRLADGVRGSGLF